MIKKTNDRGAATLPKAASWWRCAAIGLIGAAFLASAITLDAAKGGKPGKPGGGDDPTDPPDPPVLADSVIYYGWGWGYDPQQFWQMDPDGSNQQLLFELDVESVGYRYEHLTPSMHTYGTDNSRYFACLVNEETPNPPTANLFARLLIVDESNQIVLDILEGSNVGVEQKGQYPGAGFVWYDEDRRLAFMGRELIHLENGEVVTDWNTLGIYTVDLEFDSAGDIVGSEPPQLVEWTNQYLVAEDTDPYYSHT